MTVLPFPQPGEAGTPPLTRTDLSSLAAAAEAAAQRAEDTHHDLHHTVATARAQRWTWPALADATGMTQGALRMAHARWRRSLAREQATSTGTDQ